MTRRRRIAVVAVAGAVVAGAVWAVLRVAGPAAPAAPVASTRTTTARPFRAIPGDTEAAVTGRVIDIRAQRPVGDVEVVFRGAAGDASAQARDDGSYEIRVAPGTYRTFVRHPTIMSVARPDRVRLPDLPPAEIAGVPDEALMAIVVVSGDASGIDLSVVRGGVVTGRVVDRSGRPIGGAVVRARSDGVRPTLSSDIAVADHGGAFELRLPPGVFELEASHARFAGPQSRAAARITVQAGDHVMSLLTLTAGCVIEGRVVGRDGTPSGDGAIELQWGVSDVDFAPAGRIAPDGSFRWTTTDERDVTLRAWPWKSPASPPRRFACHDDARFEVVFQIPESRPSLEGVLVDQGGAPVGFAFVDLVPLDRGGIAQQERTDAAGRWEIYDVLPGRYRVVAHAEGRGIAAVTVVSPRDSLRLELSGTGRIEGTVSRLASGSFELVLGTCLDTTGQVPVPQSRRVVAVTGGRFAVDGIPACQLAFNAVWRGTSSSQQVSVPSGGIARLDIDLGPLDTKVVRGTVRDTTGKAIGGAQITSTHHGETIATAKADASGAYTIRTVSGASLRASLGDRSGLAQVGGANIESELVDVIVDD